MKLVIPGGSGQVGTLVARAHHERGHEVVVLSRFPSAMPWRTAAWDGSSLGDWVAEIEGADAVLNLAGRNVNCRYHAANREAIMRSRVDSTRVLGEAIADCREPPPLWLQASTATIYAHRFDAPNDEATGRIGGTEEGAPESWRFSIEVARAWEAALAESDTPRTRKLALRSAVILSPDRGGIFDVLLGLVRRGLGGRCGSGRQFVSWIHETDFLGALDWLIEHPELDGVVNLASPNPLPQDEFMRLLRRAWGAPFGLPATAAMVKIGAFVLRTESELILKSRRVVPGRLLESGFEFEHADWPAAAQELCTRWREERKR